MPRHLAIGDIHGCFNALRTLCDYVQLEDDDVIIPLGDYCDRGPNTYAVIDFLIHLSSKHTVHPLRGNHDIMMLNAGENDIEFTKWMNVGGDKTLQSYSPLDGADGTLADVPDRHWKWLTNDLLPYFESESHFYVHANAYPDVPLPDQPDFMLYWEQFNDPPAHESGKAMVCGHTSQKTGQPIANQHAVCIDTWACGRGWLSCLHSESGMIWQANELGQTRKFWLDDLPLQDAT